MTFRALGTWLCALVLGVGLTGCGSLTNGFNRDTFKPYVPEVVQGNFVSKEQRQALRPGMSRAEVRDILGTPLVTSLFHADRWDYAFSIQRQGVPPKSFSITVFFKGDAMASVEGGELPSEAEFVSSISVQRAAPKAPPLQASEEELKKFPLPKSTTDARPAPAPLPTSYPPLEPTPR